MSQKGLDSRGRGWESRSRALCFGAQRLDVYPELNPLFDITLPLLRMLTALPRGARVVPRGVPDLCKKAEQLRVAEGRTTRCAVGKGVLAI